MTRLYEKSLSLHQQNGAMTVLAFADMHGVSLQVMHSYIRAGRVIGAQQDARSKRWTIYPPAVLMDRDGHRVTPGDAFACRARRPELGELKAVDVGTSPHGLSADLSRADQKTLCALDNPPSGKPGFLPDISRPADAECGSSESGGLAFDVPPARMGVDSTASPSNCVAASDGFIVAQSSPSAQGRGNGSGSGDGISRAKRACFVSADAPRSGSCEEAFDLCGGGSAQGGNDGAFSDAKRVRQLLQEAVAKAHREGIHYLRLEGREFSQVYAAVDRERSRIRKLVGKGLVAVGDLRVSDSIWQKLQAMCREGRLL